MFDLGFLCKLGLGNVDFPLSLPIEVNFSLRKENEGVRAEGGVKWKVWVEPISLATFKVQIQILGNSKHIDVYTQKGRKRHFEHNGGGLVS